MVFYALFTPSQHNQATSTKHTWSISLWTGSRSLWHVNNHHRTRRYQATPAKCLKRSCGHASTVVHKPSPQTNLAAQDCRTLYQSPWISSIRSCRQKGRRDWVILGPWAKASCKSIMVFYALFTTKPTQSGYIHKTYLKHLTVDRLAGRSKSQQTPQNQKIPSHTCKMPQEKLWACADCCHKSSHQANLAASGLQNSLSISIEKHPIMLSERAQRLGHPRALG